MRLRLPLFYRCVLQDFQPDQRQVHNRMQRNDNHRSIRHGWTTGRKNRCQCQLDQHRCFVVDKWRLYHPHCNIRHQHRCKTAYQAIIKLIQIIEGSPNGEPFFVSHFGICNDTSITNAHTQLRQITNPPEQYVLRDL